MNEELFNSISMQLDKSGTTVSRKADGTITVSLPDSEELLAECKDNGDGTLSYTIKMGDGTEETGNGTPEEFRSHVIDALDSWIEYSPYDKDTVEPGITAEYRRSIGESRADDVRNALYEMGLDDTQADAIVEAVGVLYESSLVTVTIGGKPVTGSSINDIATRKENRPFLKRQWVLNQFKKLGKTPSGKLLPTDVLINELGIEPPTNDDLVNFVKGYMDTMQEERLHSDDEILADIKAAQVRDNTGATMANESPVESGEKDDYDEEIEAREKRVIRNKDDEVAPTSEREASEQYGIELKEKTQEDVTGDVSLYTLWDGDASVLGQVDAGSGYDIPEKAIGQAVEETGKLKESFNDILAAIPAFGPTPTGFVLQMIFGRPGAGLRGAVLDLFNGKQSDLYKINAGEGILDASKATPAQRAELAAALKTPRVKSAIKRVQDGFGELADLIEKIIPAAYDESRGVEPGSEDSVNDRIDEVPGDFVNLFRTLLRDKGVPFAAYPWTAVDKMCSNLGDILKLNNQVAAGRKVTGAPVGTKATA